MTTTNGLSCDDSGKVQQNRWLQPGVGPGQKTTRDAFGGGSGTFLEAFLKVLHGL